MRRFPGGAGQAGLLAGRPAADRRELRSRTGSVSRDQPVVSETADEGLFKIGCIYAHPKNSKRDYQKSLDVFRQLVTEHPRSNYREPADAFIAILGELASRERELASRDRELTNRDRGAPALRRQVDSLEKQVETLQKQIEQMKEIDRSLEEKRRNMPPRK